MKHCAVWPAAGLLLWVAALYWLPEHLAVQLGWHQAALEYVVTRVELAALWCGAALWLLAQWWGKAAAPVAMWAGAEAAMGAAARLSLPMCCPLTDRNRPLGVQAWGEGAQWLSLMLAAAAIWWVGVHLRSAAQPGVADGRAQR